MYPQFPDRLAWLMGLEFFGWAESCSASAGWNCRMKSHSAGTSPIFTTSWGTHLISSSNATACLSAPNHWVSGFEPLHWLASPATCRKSTSTKYCTGLFTILYTIYTMTWYLVILQFLLSLLHPFEGSFARADGRCVAYCLAAKHLANKLGRFRIWLRDHQHQHSACSRAITIERSK